MTETVTNNQRQRIRDRVEQLLLRADEAHRRARARLRNEDDEWPMWLANFIRQDINRLLQTSFSCSELIYLIVRVSKEHRVAAPGVPWARYYAVFFCNLKGQQVELS